MVQIPRSADLGRRPFHHIIEHETGRQHQHAYQHLSRVSRGWPSQRGRQAGPQPPRRVDDGIRLTMVGHATVLVQTAGLNLLTDPTWSDRCNLLDLGLGLSWGGPRRARPPGVRFEDLPRIDAILLSHDHQAHLDIPTLRRLHRAYQPAIYAGLGTAARLERQGIGPITELDWWDGAKLGPLTIHGLPARRPSSRIPFERARILPLSFWLQSPAGSLYFAGDIGFGAHLPQICSAFGPVDIALLPIDDDPRWSFTRPVHTAPAEAVAAHQALQASVSVPIHYGVFPSADERDDEPLKALGQALHTVPGRPHFHLLDCGQAHTFAAEVMPFRLAAE